MPTLRWGVLGAAGIAKAAVVPAIQRSRNGRVVAIGTRDVRGAEAWAGDVGVERVLGSYDEVIDHRDIDAVYIPLPNSLHAEWGAKAAAAGKAVLCEKPLALNAAEAERLAEPFARKGVPLMEGFMYRFHPQHERVREKIAAGEIGELREVHAHLSVDLMSPVDPRNVRFDPALGGGARLDMGCYVVSIARLLFASEPTHVLASEVVDPASGVDVTVNAILEFSRGRRANVSCSFAANGQGFYRAIGSKGMIDVPRALLPGLGDRVGSTLVITVDPNGVRHEEELPATDQYQLMVEAFADAVLRRTPVPILPADSIANLRVLDAIGEAARGGRAQVYT